MAYFETLDELDAWASRSGVSVDVVDPGVPLTDWADDLAYGPAWKNQPSVRKVVGFIARQLASTPLHLFERTANDDRTRVRDGALAGLLVRPSRAPGMTAYRFWSALMTACCTTGCAKINEHEDGYSLTRIPAKRVKFKSNWLGEIEKIKITDDKGNTLERTRPAT